MRPSARVLSGLVCVLACTVWASAGTAAVSAPIKPHQHFVGIVNGTRASITAVPVVYTVCAGPSSPGHTGPLAGGQTLAVARVARGGGYTGPFSHVYAWFSQDASPGGPQQVTFTSYTTMPAPTGVQVPCDGSGQVDFSPCPSLTPCAAGWTPDIVPVRFENVAI
jgi:hypothetical protein